MKALRKLTPKTLFARTSLILTTAMLALLLFFSTIVYQYLLNPLAQRAAEDFAALIVFSAQTWVELPPVTRADFEEELYSQHQLLLFTNIEGIILEPLTQKPSHLQFLEQALSTRMNQPILLFQSPKSLQDLAEVWVNIPMAESTLHFGFSHNAAQIRPSLVAFLLIAGSVLIALLTSLLLVRRLTRQIQQLLQNRTTLLSGISHDLRTPIARLQLSLEFLNQEKEAELLCGMRRDLKEMDQLIGRTLALARGMDEVNRKKLKKQKGQEKVEMTAWIHAFIAEYNDFPDSPARIECQLPDVCSVFLQPIILRRVLSNLIENALRYGENHLVILRLNCTSKTVTIEVLDQGLGIPEHELATVFQPFHRLEQSRNTKTGGSGLGLAIVKQLCEIEGWNVILQSRKPTGLCAKITIKRR